MKKLLTTVVIAACFLTGCDRPVTQTLNVHTTGDYQVELVGEFEDQMAYRGQRGIYRITDTKTGQTFVGVSGIGIAEVGVHGKGQRDER